MLLPTIFGESLFDDYMDFDFPRFADIENLDKKLYGKKASRIMKTDVHEHDDHFEADIDLPGFKKDQISLELRNGYLTITAAKNLEENGKDDKGRLVHQERYTGTMSRSYYLGEHITEEDVKAKFEDGVLTLCFPKEDAKKLPERRYIQIEG